MTDASLNGSALFTFPDNRVLDLGIIRMIGPLYVAGERWKVVSESPHREVFWETKRRLWYAPWKVVVSKKSEWVGGSQQFGRDPEIDEYQFQVWLADGRDLSYPSKVDDGKRVRVEKEWKRRQGGYSLVDVEHPYNEILTESVEAHRREPVETVRAALIEAWRAAKANIREPIDPQKS